MGTECPESWLTEFQSTETRIAKLVPKHWGECRKAISSSSEENFITNNLIYHLSKDAKVRRMGYLEAQYVPFELTVENEVESVNGKGYIDMALVMDGDRNKYVAFECKRLNVVYPTGRQSLATDYVNEGLRRYIDEQYSKSLPFACMLGYVMDGDLEYALTKVTKSIKSIMGKSAVNPHQIENISRFESFHQRTGGSMIRVAHSFLSVA